VAFPCEEHVRQVNSTGHSKTILPAMAAVMAVQKTYPTVFGPVLLESENKGPAPSPTVKADSDHRR
jgi:hypothetical protein